jgi:hypothetical protein
VYVWIEKFRKATKQTDDSSVEFTDQDPAFVAKLAAKLAQPVCRLLSFFRLFVSIFVSCGGDD